MELIQINTLKNEMLTKIGMAHIECRINLNRRMRTTSGRCYYTESRIDLNTRLLEANPNHVCQTLAHELAHLVAYVKHGRAALGHGQLWRGIMRQLGYTPNRCHTLDVSGLRIRHEVKGHAKCTCRTIPLKARRFNKMKRGVKYTCLKCGNNLTLVVK